MKKLGKKINMIEETIEAYACNCSSSCSCGCACYCNPGIAFLFSNSNSAYDALGTSDYNDEQSNSNYSK